MVSFFLPELVTGLEEQETNESKQNTGLGS